LRPHDPPEEAAAPPSITKVLVPLDGSALAEEVLGPAAALARLLGARCTLLRVVEARPHPPAAPHGGELPLDPCVGEARSYLRGVAEKLSEQSLPADIQVVVAPHAAGAILEAAQTEPGTLIALATHGHGGFRRMLLGSVADKLIRAAAGPVLVYRPTAGSKGP
jgi:nucleotide-binding universal stress UspA family protein